MIKSFILDEPTYLILLVPIILSMLTTSKLLLYIINVLVLLLLTASHMMLDSSYIDAWIFAFIFVISFIYRKKERIGDMLKFRETVYFSGIEKYVYDRDFKLLFTEEEFRLFIDIAQMKKNKEKSQLAVEGEKIEKIIYIATIPKYKSLSLKTNETIISYLHDGAWLGVIEFIAHLSKVDFASNYHDIDNRWLVSVGLESKEIEIVYFEWDFVSLTNLFKFSNDYKFINKLLLIWTKYLSHSIFRLDDHIANALKALVSNDKKARENVSPSHRYALKRKEEEDKKQDEEGEYSDLTFKRRNSKLNKVGADLNEMKYQ